MLLWVTVSSFALLSCADDLEVKSKAPQLAENEILVKFNLNSEEIVKTRDLENSDEKNISSFDVYIFSVSGASPQKLVQIPQLSNPSSTDVKTISLNGEAYASYKDEGLYIVGVANCNASYGTALSGIAVGETYTDFSKRMVKYLSANTESGVTTNHGFIMSGAAAQENVNDVYEIPLNRLAAKVSIQANSAEIPEGDSFEYLGYTMYNGAEEAFVTAPSAADDSRKFTSETSKLKEIDAFEDADYEFINYTAPVKSAGSETENSTGAYFIIHGKYNDVECYYRVDLKISDENDQNNGATYYDLNPNHWYQVNVTGIARRGYLLATEAAKHYMGEEGAVTVDIHDHSANVMSMVADAHHELGVSRQIYYDGAALDSQGQKIYSDNKTTFIIRFFCDNDGKDHTSHIPTIKNGTSLEGDDFSIDIEDDWLAITKVEDVSSDTSELSGVSDNDPTESNGTRYKLTVTFYPEKMVEGETTITVNWLGFKIKVSVDYKENFDATKILDSTTLYIHNTDNDATITKNYWDFLGKTVKGVDIASMGEEKRRDDGFHFPIMYGKSADKPWYYTYELTLKNAENVVAYNFNLECSQNSTVWNNLEVKDGKGNIYTLGKNAFVNANKKNSTSNTFTFTRPSTSNDYDYSTAVLVMRMYTGEKEYVERKFNLYHTGFFHEDGSDWFYYEVVELADGKHWLDRNIRATSNGLYIQTESNESLFSASDTYPFSTGKAAGDYVYVADGVDYQKPKFTKGVNICPPGYRIPKQSEFDKLRTSPNFHKEHRNDASASYYTSYYQSSSAGRIYFPKSQFKNSDQWAGDPRAGYYWTQTIASGYEKKQIGHWVKAFTLSGNSSNFINADVDHYAMSLRCIEGQASESALEEESYTIGFKIYGATHVYLYSKVGNTRTGIFEFPGKGVCSDVTTEQLFSYNSSVTSENLYVYFTYKDSKGKIWVISPEDPSKYTPGETINGDLTDEALFRPAADIDNLSSIQGWPVSVGGFYKFVWDNAKVFFDYSNIIVLNINIHNNICKNNIESNKYNYLRAWIDSSSMGVYKNLSQEGNNPNYSLTDTQIHLNMPYISAVYFQLATDANGSNATKVYTITPADCGDKNGLGDYEFYLNEL